MSALDFSKLGLAAVESEDLTVDQSFVRELPRAGIALMRLREYIELGRHESKNPAHKPSQKAILVFELSHPDHLIEVDGKKVPQSFMVRLNKGGTAKSGYKKLFNLMNDALGGTCKHFVQMIGKPFLGELFHNKSEDGKQTYVNLDKDGAYSIKEAAQVDVLANTKTPIPVMELIGTPRCFLWENESISDADIKAMWDSIFIEGTREVVDEKSKEKKEVSKNWIQENIMANIEWEGSRTQGLVTEYVDLEAAPAEATEATVDLAANASGEAPVPSLED